MKKTALTLLTGLTLAAAAQAGEDYSAKAPAPVVEPCLWSWFTGASAGYLQDFDAAMYTAHVGAEYTCPGSESSHAIFLEAGYATEDYSVSGIDFDINIVPVTLNYKYENVLTGNLNWYIGAGAGVAFVDVDVQHYDDLDETEFYGQIFAGLVYNVSEQVEIFGGARYVYMDDESDFDTYGDDAFYELGARYNF